MKVEFEIEDRHSLLVRFGVELREYALPPDPSLLAKSIPELDLYDPRVAEVDAGWALREAKNGEAAALRHDKRVTNSEGATWSRVLGATAFATSGGFVGGYRGSYASLVVEPLCDDDTDKENPKKRNGYWWTASRFLAALDIAEAVGIAVDDAVEVVVVSMAADLPGAVARRTPVAGRQRMAPAPAQRIR